MWSVALKAPNGRRVQWMDAADPKWHVDAGATIDTWAHKTLLAEDWDAWIMYNDEPPGQKAAGSSGHCKGVIAWNAQKVGWLIHSVPLWPPAFTETIDKRELLENIPDDQVKFGQSFAWVELPRADLGRILQHVALMQPKVYAVNDPESNWKPMQSVPKDKALQISWINLEEGVRHVAKCRQWNSCLFQDGLIAALGGPCIAETWCRPKPVPTPEVFNAVVLGWPDSKPLVAYHEGQDHSKYAVSEGERPWTYVGDINNMKSQWKRGGGGLVFDCADIHKAFRSLIQTDDRTG